MTQPVNQSAEAPDQAGGEPTDVPGDDRDPLSTDDGLAEIAAGMPEVEDPPGEDAQPGWERPLLDTPELDVADDGTDPAAELGHCDDDGED